MTLIAPTLEELGARALGEDPDHPGWQLIEVTCSTCGEASRIHEQPPEFWTHPTENRHPVDGRHLGLEWECTQVAGEVHRNNLGGEAPMRPDTYVLECGNCHSTFAPSQTEIAADGTWTCRVCDTENRDVHEGDAGNGATSGVLA